MAVTTFAWEELAVAPTRIGARRRFAGWAIFALLLLVIVGLYPLSGGVKDEMLTGDGDVLRQISFVLIFLFVVMTQRMLYETAQWPVLPLTLVLLFGWCALSLTWAIEPGIAFRRLALTSLIVLTIFFVVERAGTERTLAVMRSALLIVLIVNYLAVLLSPMGVHLPGELDAALVGNWRGVLPQKNFAGSICAFTIIVFFYSGGRTRPLLRWTIIAAAAVFLVHTQSKTSMGLLVISLVIGLVFKWFSPRQRKLLIPALVVLIALLVMLGQDYLGEVSAYLSQPDALTGRGQIWPILIAFANEHLMLGAGYGSFWNIGADSPINDYSRAWVSQMASGHNGYLDVLVQIGLPGLILTVLAAIVAPFWKLVTSKTISRRHGAMMMAMLAFCAGHNLTETSLLDRDAIVWVFLVFVIALVGRMHRDGRMRPAVAA
jgi:O-antigen ligase